jgi:phosphodiesterase/alkaline phosphatase D-like protein
MKQLLILLLLVVLFGACQKHENYFQKSWDSVNDRVWVGSEFWSNRLQDWKIQNGQLECIANNPKLLMRTTHLINCRLADKEGQFFGKIKLGSLQESQNNDASAGFLLGAGSKLDVWGASLIQQKLGPGAGLFAGITSAGNLFIKDMENDTVLSVVKSELLKTTSLSIKVVPEKGGYKLILSNGDTRLELPEVNSKKVTGNIALVSHPGTGKNPGTFWFNKLEVWGDKLETFKETAGPIISSQYTLSKNILKLTAQIVPIAKTDPQEIKLEIKKGNEWQEISKTKIITPGYTATFKLKNWDSLTDIPFRVKYTYQSSTDQNDTDYWEGTIRHDPTEKEEIVIAGFTGNHNIAHPGLSGVTGTFNFNLSGIWYPHTEIVNNITIHNPDVLFFSGDQVYESYSPTFPDKEHYELDYLYKWYLYCLAYRNLTKDIPTISIPDDHDMYQGNIWGQGGRSADIDNKGGYVHPAWFAQMVERTQCSNLPDPYDPTPIDQNIGVYYTSMNYGGIGFAILEDRKFKSGCADNPFITKGRPDHVIDPEFEIKKIDLPGKKLMGERQLNFLNNWATDWKGQQMKIALSQTIFANMATHHGSELFRLIADLDSNGWPQTGRNKAIKALRQAFVFHLAGDQHLASIVHHGVDEWNDAIYSFCVPSIANFYPRAWWPETIGKDRQEDDAQNMGKHKDGFGNLVTVYGVTNPSSFTKISTNQEPLEIHDKMPGYGIVKMNKQNRTITMECWPRYANPKKGEQQYKGWPKTISQFDNYGREAVAYLPSIVVKNLQNPVIEIINEKTEKLVYCVRIKGNEYKAKVFNNGNFTIKVKDTEKNIEQVFNNIPTTTNSNKKIIVMF